MALLLALLGAPGAGKGTQAEILAGKTGMRHIATGDMLREAVARGTEKGRAAKRYMERGELVPDELIVGIVRDELGSRDRAGNGVVLDGFPRTEAQAKALDEMLDEMGTELGAVIYIDVPEEELIRRLSGRRVCESCGANFHVYFNPPPAPEVCPNCGGKLRQRPDDAEETVKRRLQVYREQTEPLIQYYRKRGLLRRVDGRGSIQQVSSAIRAELERTFGARFNGFSGGGVRPRSGSPGGPAGIA